MKEFKLRYTRLQPGKSLLQWPKRPVSGPLYSLRLRGTLTKLSNPDLPADETEVSSPVCYAGKEQFRPGFE